MSRRCLTAVSLVAVAVAFALPVQAQPDVVVHGDTDCPSAEMIRAALLAARPSGEWPQRTVTVEAGNARLSLRLGDAPVVPRELPADADCSVRAASVAVVMAAWAGELESRPTDSPVLTATATTMTTTTTTTTAAPAAPTVTAPPQRHHVLELDGGAFYSPWWGRGPGAWLGAGRTPHDGGLGARVALAYQAGRDLALEAGTNQVLRFLIAATVTYHLQRAHFFTSGDLGLVGTYTRAQGGGYETNRSDATANFGALADLRGGLRFGRARAWLDARVVRLVSEESVKIQSTSPGVDDRARLAAWDLQLGVGVGYRLD